MKNRFPGYFDLTEAEHDQLWDEGLIVIDTNVLLDLYRVPEPTRNRMFELLASWKGRVWIPHQVGVEFLGMRVSTINEVHKRSTSVVDEMRAKYEAFRSAAQDMKLAERGFDDVDRILKEMGALSAELEEGAAKMLSGALQPNDHDHVLEKLDSIVDGNVGEAPENQDALSKIYREGEGRYELKLGPGYEDAKKSERKGAKYRVGGLTYESQYSDLVLWKQTIAYVKSVGVKSVLFVSKDVKKDWWQIVNGDDRIAPLPELREEMIRDGGVERFWIITLEDALAKYGVKNGVDVEQAVKDVRRTDVLDEISLIESVINSTREITNQILSVDYKNIRNVIAMDDAAKALNLDIAYKSNKLLGGRSSKNHSAGALITTLEQIQKDPIVTSDKAKGAMTALRESRGVSDYYLVIVVPEKSSSEDIHYAETFGTSICLRLTGQLDRLMVGHVENGQFNPYHDLHPLNNFL